MNNQRTIRLCAMAIIIALGCTSCATRFTYEPPIIPVQFLIDPMTGAINVQSEFAIKTLIGKIGIESESPTTINSPYQGVMVVFHNERQQYYEYYLICTDGEQFTAIINGRTKISATNRIVEIDISDGNVESVEVNVQRMSDQPLEGGCSKWKPYPGGYYPFKFFKMISSTAAPEQGWITFVAQYFVAIIAGIFDLLIMLILTPGVLIETWIAPPNGKLIRNIYLTIIILVPPFALLICNIVDCKQLLHRRKQLH